MRALTHLHMVRNSRFHRYENNRQNVKNRHSDTHVLRQIDKYTQTDDSYLRKCF